MNSVDATVYIDIKTQAPNIKKNPDESSLVDTIPFETKSPIMITSIPTILFFVGDFFKNNRIKGTITILSEAKKLAVEEGI